jgi:hypothetical protein
MTTKTSSIVRPVTAFTRVVFVLAALLATIAGIQLYILTDRTGHYFAWTIAQPLSATFLGAGYWTGATLLIFAAGERAWANIRIAVAAVAAFVPLMLLATLLHLDRFHFQSGDPVARVAAWAWIIVYVVVPFVILAVILFQLRTPGGDPPGGASIQGWIRVLIGVNAAISLIVCVGLFLSPGASSLWPWQLTPLTAQSIASGFLALAVASAQFIRENTWSRGRVGTLSYLLVGGLQLIALARYPGTVAWSRPGAWLYVLFMAGIVCGGVYSTIAVRKAASDDKRPLASPI